MLKITDKKKLEGIELIKEYIRLRSIKNRTWDEEVKKRGIDWHMYYHHNLEVKYLTKEGFKAWLKI